MTNSEIKSSDEALNTNLDVSLLKLLNICLKDKFFIFFTTAIAILLSIIVSLNLPNYYISQAVLLPVDSDNSGNNLSSYSGLASLAGINLPKSSTSNVDQIIAIIKSREFVKHLLTFDGILPAIMATDSYDHSSQKIEFDKDKYDSENATWIEAKPSYLDVHLAYKNIMSVSQDIDTGLVLISVEHKSPEFAKILLEKIISEANNIQRQKDIYSSGRALEHLKEELGKTSLAEIKISINQLIESQLERQMLANINQEYSLEIIEPPYIPEIKSKPKRSVIVIWSTILGFIIGLISALYRFYSNDLKNVLKSTGI